MTRPGSAHIIRGNALALPLPDASVDLVVTSPPYFGLRSYQDTPQLCARCLELTGHGWEFPRSSDARRDLRQAWPDWDAHVAAEHKPSHYAGQIGSEPTPAEFIDALIAATREMVRVLKPSGSIFVNLGDKYGGTDGTKGGTSMSTLTSPANGRPRAMREGTFDGGGRRVAGRPKSLLLLPERYRIACVDQLGLIARAVIVWNKPNGLPESVTDRVRRSHEDWVHLTKQPRYYSAVDEIREPITDTSEHAATRRHRTDARMDLAHSARTSTANPLGKLPGSVWTVPTQPLTVPPELGVDHFAAFPMEWPRRIIQGWSPAGVCTVCGEGRRPVGAASYEPLQRTNGVDKWTTTDQDGRGQAVSQYGRARQSVTITGYACACPEPTAPTRPSTILDPFGGTGTTALMAKALGRTGISVDMSADYCRLAAWRTTDPGQMAAALQVEKPKLRPVEQGTLELEL